MQQLQETIIKDVSADGCARELLAAVPAVMRFLRGQMRRHRQSELTVPQFRVLVKLSHNDGTMLSAVAEHVGLSLPAASRMVEGLVRRGLVERATPSGDRRRVALSLTRRGREVFQKALTATQIALVQGLQALSGRELAKVSEASRILTRVFAPENSSPEPVR